LLTQPPENQNDRHRKNQQAREEFHGTNTPLIVRFIPSTPLTNLEQGVSRWRTLPNLA
jgi:hypothetical protein